ncbi:phosphate-starvation-inducible PsiE family protein [Desulfoluna sp.]|uniref:phosphate-starvation-inducible PsiE family protein n=1 Tax=Desulfoluna sp. TaxID=2045199 RepID=UPI002622274D|nr:phosphate-starvation-inducible PsiE family protein [Desulfoluna sp.]
MEQINEPIGQRHREREEPGRVGRWMETIHPRKIFFITQEVMVNIMIVYIIVVLAVALGKTLMDAGKLLHGLNGEGFTSVVAEVLSFLVMLELFRGFVDFFSTQRIRLHTMMDPAILFVVREVMIALYRNEAKGPSWELLMGFSLLLVSLGIIRTLAVRYTPGS